MSTSQTKVSYLSDFNFESVLKELNISKKQQSIIRALRFVYNCALNEQRNNFKSRRDLIEAAAQITIKRTQFIYELIDTYSQNYLPRDRTPKDALFTAALIGDLIEKANIKGRKKDFSTRFLADIRFLHQEAESICNGHTGDFHPHALFLAHIRSLQFIQTASEALDEFELSDLDAMLENNIPVIEDLSDKRTDIGFELNEQCMFFRDVLDERINELCDEYELEAAAKDDFGATLISMIPPLKTKRENLSETSITYITDFNECAIYEQLSIKDDELAAKASIRLIFNELIRETNITTLDERKEAIEAVIRATAVSYYLASEMARDFMNGSRGEKEALVVAAICEHQSYKLGQQKIIDTATSDFAQIINEEAVSGLCGHPEHMTCPQSQGLSYIFAIKKVVDIISDLSESEFESEEDFRRIHDDLMPIRAITTTNTALGQKFQESIDMLQNNLAALHFDTRAPLDQAQDFLSRREKPVEPSTRALLQQVLYANDFA